jgi:tetraacyldisaccharide-1-P 4'-kinase
MRLGLFESILLPFAALHGAALLTHQRFLRREAPIWMRRFQSLTHRPPCLVVGGLRMKGSGKSTVTSRLARLGIEKGLKVAILAYARPAHFKGPPPSRVPGLAASGALAEVTLQTPWRLASDEALMHKWLNPEARVYVTRHRAAAYMALAAAEQGLRPDLVLCDDGLFDPRLAFASRWVLLRPGEVPTWRQLFPAGPQRGTLNVTLPGDLRLTEGSGEREDPDADITFHRVTFWGAGQVQLQTKPKPGLALCAHGHAESLLAGLAAEGLPVAELRQARNHLGFAPRSLRQWIQAHPGAPLYCGPRDAVKVMEDCGAVPSGNTLPMSFRLDLGEGIQADLWVCRHEACFSPKTMAWLKGYGPFAC